MANIAEIDRTKAFIRELESISGWPVSKMAKDAGFAHTTLSRFMSSDKPKHNIKLSTLAEIANNLLEKLSTEVAPSSHQTVERIAQENDGIIQVGMAPDDIEKTWRLAQIISEFGIPSKNDLQYLDSKTPKLRIVNKVEARKWHTGLIQSLGNKTIKAIDYPHNQFPDRVIGIEVGDNSVNQKFPEGTTLICLPCNTSSPTPTGHFYIVTRENHEIEETEITCKRLEHDDQGKLWLFPESTDPRHSPIMLGDDMQGNGKHLTDFYTTTIQAVVVGAIVKFSFP